MLPGSVSYRCDKNHLLLCKPNKNQTKIRINFSQQTTYCKLFSAILRQWNRNWTKRRSKPVEYELVGQNCVVRTFTYTIRNITQKQMDMLMDMTQKNRWTLQKKDLLKITQTPMNTRVRREVLFRFLRFKMEYFSDRNSRTFTCDLDVLQNSQYIHINPSVIL